MYQFIRFLFRLRINFSKHTDLGFRIILILKIHLKYFYTNAANILQSIGTFVF